MNCKTEVIIGLGSIGKIGFALIHKIAYQKNQKTREGLLK